MINSKDNRTTNEIIRALEIELNQEGLKKSNKIYFDCPKCDKKQHELKFHLFDITYDSFGFKCFSCGFKGNSTQLIKELNLFETNNLSIINFNSYKRVEAPASKQKKDIDIDFSELKEILSLFFSNSPLTEKHKKQYIKKRDSKPDINNTFSFNPKAYDMIKNRYGKEKTDKLFYHFNKKTNEYYLEDCILFTTRDLDNNIIFFESKRYIDKFQRPLRNLGLNNKLPVFFNYINDSIKTIIICEGIEKAQTINEIFEYKRVLAVSIGSIQAHNLLLNDIVIETFKDKEVIISFDSKNLKYITLAEEKASLELSKKLINHDLDVYISFLPRPETPEVKEHDFDSYFYGKDKKFRENAIYDLIENKYREYDIKERFKDYLDKQQEPLSSKRKHKIEYFNIQPDNRLFQNLEDFRKDLPLLFENLLYNYKNGVIVVKAPTGVGKSYAVSELMKRYKILFLSHNKDLVNEMYSNSTSDNVEIVYSMTDTLVNEINKSNLSPTDKEKLINDVHKLMSKGYGDKAKTLVEKKLNIKPIIYKKYSDNKSLLATHHKAITDNSLLSMSFDAVITDEAIDDKIINKIDITLEEIKHDITFYKSSDFKELIEIFIEFINDLPFKELSKINIRKEFIEYLKNRDRIKLLYKRIDRIKLNKQKINEIKDIDLLPDKTGKIKKLFEAIKNDTLYFNIEESFVTHKVFSFHVLSEFKTKNTLMILDATANKEILELIGFKVSKFVDVAIKNDNLTVFQYPEYTFKTSNILKDDLHKNKFKELIDKIKTPKSLLFTTKKIVDSFNFNIDVGYYGKHDKGINIFNDNDSEIITTPENNEKECISKANLLYGKKIKTYETYYLFERTGYIEDNKEVQIESYHFKDKNLDKVYQYFLKAPMRQAIGRITRDYNKKRTIHILSNVSLFEYDIRVNKIVYFDKKDLRQEKTINTEKELRRILINSLSQNSIIYTDSFKNLFYDFSKLGINYHNNTLVNAINQHTPNISNPVIAQLCKTYNSNSINNTDFALLHFKEKSLEEIKVFFEQNFNISDRTFETIKKDVFSELKLNSYYLAPIKQGVFYTDNINLANQIIDFYKSYQNNSRIKDIKNDSINTPIDNLNLDNELINDYLDNSFDTEKTINDEMLNINVINDSNKKDSVGTPAPAGEVNTNDTINTQKIEQNSYYDFVNNNLSYLFDCLDKFITKKSLSGELIDDKDFLELEEKYLYYVDKELIKELFTYEYLIKDITENMDSYNQQIKELIEFNNTHNQIIHLKENYDNYVRNNAPALKNKVDNLIISLVEQDRLIDNKLLDDLLSKAKFHLDNGDIETSLSYQFLVFDLTENIDKYSEYINKKQVEKDKYISLIELSDIDYENTYVEIDLKNILETPSYYKLPDISDITKKQIDKLYEVKISYSKEAEIDLFKDENKIFSIFFDDPKKRILAKTLNSNINKIPNIDEQKNLRKYISMLIIKKINLNHEYFKKLDKWVIQALCIDDLIKRQHLRDFIKEHTKTLEYLIS